MGYIYFFYTLDNFRISRFSYQSNLKTVLNNDLSLNSILKDNERYSTFDRVKLWSKLLTRWFITDSGHVISNIVSLQRCVKKRMIFLFSSRKFHIEVRGENDFQETNTNGRATETRNIHIITSFPQVIHYLDKKTFP